MASVDPIKTLLHRHMPHFESRYHVSRMGIFGSTARGDARPGSDIDLLVEFSSPIGLDFVLLADELESILGRKVDLVPANAVKPKMMKSIGEDIIYV